MLLLYVEAPFAVSRTFTAGWYRPTAAFLSHSSVYGLLLNLAGVESRLREEDADYPAKQSVPTTLTRSNLPAVNLALGVPIIAHDAGDPGGTNEGADPYPRVQSIYQQLHNYPIGSSGGERAATSFGNKYNITPVRRELLCGVRAVVAVDGNPDLETDIRAGLEGSRSESRYGLPFLGDNAFLPDRIEILREAAPTHWYEALRDEGPIRPRTTRLTIWIDRAEFARTKSELFAPTQSASKEPPASAWVRIDPAATTNCTS